MIRWSRKIRLSAQFAKHYPLLFHAWVGAGQSRQLFAELTVQPRLPATQEEIDSDRRKNLERLCQQIIEQTRRIIQDESDKLDNLLNKVISELDKLKGPNQ